MYCLDTNIIVEHLRTGSGVGSLAGFEGSNLVTTAVTAGELFKGVFLSGRKGSVEQLSELLESFEILPFTEEAARIYGERYADLKRAGRITQESDLMIASIAIANGVTVVTRNGKDFKNISGLKLLVI